MTILPWALTLAHALFFGVIYTRAFVDARRAGRVLPLWSWALCGALWIATAVLAVRVVSEVLRWN